jgi:hypothetical protein
MMKIRDIAAAALLLCTLAACGDDETTSSTGSGGSGGGTPEPTMVATADGSITLDVGSGNCVVTYTVTGALEDHSTPWHCPGCATPFRAARNSSDGCFDGAEPPADITFGWAGDGTFYFTSGTGLRLQAGTATEDGDTVTLGGTGKAPNDATIALTGELTIGSAEGDPLAGWVPAESYDCGWPKGDPPAYEGGYTPASGAALPDAVLEDQCGQKVRLHDLLGSYLLIHMGQTATDCPPCTAAEMDQAGFESAMATAGIPTLVLGLLSKSFTNPNTAPTKTELESWVTRTSTAGVALSDRGFAPNLIASLEGNLGYVGYPSFIVVAPDGTMIHQVSGGDSWGALQAQIEAHAAMQ